MLKLKVVVTSTRPGRVGLAVGRWFAGFAREKGNFEVALVDLVEVGLPLFDEPNHPRLGPYVHEHTKRWSAIVREADAFVFVLPEYNYFAPPSFVNAVDYLVHEWAYKPAGFVSYGGQSGGMRSMQSAKPILTSVRVMPIPEAVAIASVANHVSEGVFAPEPPFEKAGHTMLDELHRWATALAPMRAGR